MFVLTILRTTQKKRNAFARNGTIEYTENTNQFSIRFSFRMNQNKNKTPPPRAYRCVLMWSGWLEDSQKSIELPSKQQQRGRQHSSYPTPAATDTYFSLPSRPQIMTVTVTSPNPIPPFPGRKKTPTKVLARAPRAFSLYCYLPTHPI